MLDWFMYFSDCFLQIFRLVLVIFRLILVNFQTGSCKFSDWFYVCCYNLGYSSIVTLCYSSSIVMLYLGLDMRKPVFRAGIH